MKMTTKSPISSRSLWRDKWSYPEGFIIILGLLVTGFAIEWANGIQSLPVLHHPANLIFGFSFIAILILSYLFFRKTQLILFLKSVPAAITSISFFAINALFMGLFLQESNSVGFSAILSLHQVTSSWYFLLSNLYLLTVLGMLVIDKLFHFRIKDLGIFVSHLGLWLVIFASSLGSFEMSRLEMDLTEGEITNMGLDRNKSGRSVEMPFALKLYDFELEEYAPKVGIVDNISGKLLHEQGKNIRILEKEKAFEILNYQMSILEYLESGSKVGNAYYFVNDIGAPPAVKIQSVSPSNDTLTGWISCGSFNTPYESMKLSEQHSLIMLVPEPKNYISKIGIFRPEGLEAEIQLEVNQPYQLDDWKIYQLSFNDEFGKWSNVSVVELVRDPWLPLVYSGIFLMMAGAIYMFWFGRTRRVR